MIYFRKHECQQFYIVFRLWKRIYLLHRIYDYKLYTPTVNIYIYLSKTPLPLGGFEGCFVFSPAGGMMRPASIARLQI